MASTADCLIYAIGGGHGHARRGWLVQRALATHGIRSVLLIRPNADAFLPQDTTGRLYADRYDAALSDHLNRRLPRALITDTFPHGWRGELSPRLLRGFRTRIWLARYASGLARPDPGYEHVLTPYPPTRSEWPVEPVGARAAGLLIDDSHLHLEPAPRTFLTFDPERRCAPGLIDTFARCGRRAGYSFVYRTNALQPLAADKLLVVGAGYHTFYEMLGKDIDVRFVPIRKRWDDQFRRARMYQAELGGLDELMPWLETPPTPTPCDIRVDWTHAARLITEALA